MFKKKHPFSNFFKDVKSKIDDSVKFLANLKFQKKIKVFSFFNISLFIKGLDGFLELAAGFALFFVSDEALLKIIENLTLYNDKTYENDTFYTLLGHAFDIIGNNTKYLIVIFFLLNGIVKIVLCACLIMREKWSFPVSIFFLSGLIIYQLIDALIRQSITVHVMNVFDVIVLGLIIREYYKTKYTIHI